MLFRDELKMWIDIGVLDVFWFVLTFLYPTFSPSLLLVALTKSNDSCLHTGACTGTLRGVSFLESAALQRSLKPPFRVIWAPIVDLPYQSSMQTPAFPVVEGNAGDLHGFPTTHLQLLVPQLFLMVRHTHCLIILPGTLLLWLSSDWHSYGYQK